MGKTKITILAVGGALGVFGTVLVLVGVLVRPGPAFTGLLVALGALLLAGAV